MTNDMAGDMAGDMAEVGGYSVDWKSHSPAFELWSLVGSFFFSSPEVCLFNYADLSPS